MRSITRQQWAIGFIFIALIIYYLEGILINPFAIWNASPLLISYLLVSKSIEQNSKPIFIGFVLFTFISLTLSLLGHFAWHFDWQQTKTGSSTSAILFIFIPAYAIILGGVGYVLGLFIGKLKFINKPDIE